MKRCVYFIVNFLLLTVVAINLTGCSNPKKPESELEKLSRDKTSLGVSAAARIIGESILSGNGEQVHNFLSNDCQKRITSEEITNQLNTSLSYLTSSIGIKLTDISIQSTQTRNVVKGKTAKTRFVINITGDSRDAIALELKKQYVVTTTTVVNQEVHDQVFVFPYDEPTNWMKFVYEDSHWRLKDCDEFFSSDRIFSSSS